MTSPRELLSQCARDAQQQLQLTEQARITASLWDRWLQPIGTGSGVGDDPAYDDDFQSMRDEINKLSGTNADTLCQLAEKILCHTAKDLRVITWYLQARLSLEGEKGLAEGVLLLASTITRYGESVYPVRPTARKAALEWLNGAKVLDSLALWPEVTHQDTGLTVGALCLLEDAVAGWPENDRPSFAGLCQALDTRLARSGGTDAIVPQNSSEQGGAERAGAPFSPQLTTIQSGRDLLDQSKLLAQWLGEQPQGWLASHRLMKSVRWDTVSEIPPLDASGRTRLTPPKPDHHALLKRLYRQQSWTELVEQASEMYCRGVNHFWLDLQWYLWQGLTRAGQPWDAWADAIIYDLRLFLKRMPGLETLAWNDGSPFADEVTLNWIAEKVNDDMSGFGGEAVAAAESQGDEILALETEAMEKGDSDGPEAALAWLQNRPGLASPRSSWLLRLLMARVAEQYGRNDMALHLLGELTASAPRLTLTDWEPALLFEVQARRLKLLRMKASRSESERTRLTPEMETLLAGLITLDPARAMVLCG